jgi:cell division protein FtsB
VRQAAAADIRRRRRRMISWLLVAGAGVLVVNSIVGESGYLAALQARREEARLTRALAELRLENARLQAERQQLESNPAALEEAIRRELGYIKTGETAIVVHDIEPLAETPPR